MPPSSIRLRKQSRSKNALAEGMGGLADNFIMNTLGTLAAPIYNIGLGMDPVKLGIALFIPRFIDAIADPVMGNISDNTRSRWGRRRPYNPARYVS